MMVQLFERDTPRTYVLVLDDLVMRRAEIVAFLLPWASALAMDVREVGLSEISVGSFTGQGCRMVLLAVGGVPFEDSTALHRLLQLVEALPYIPVVILSDRASNRDVTIAFGAGASGYIPAETPPDIALRALTFILNGGHFFPPTALRLLPRLSVRKLPSSGSSDARAMVHISIR